MNTPYFNFEDIEAIINNPKELANYFENTNFSENGTMLSIGSPIMSDDSEEYESEEYEDENSDNDVENMSDKEKIKLAYEILSMTSYEDEFFMGILGRLRKLLRG